MQPVHVHGRPVTDAPCRNGSVSSGREGAGVLGGGVSETPTDATGLTDEADKTSPAGGADTDKTPAFSTDETSQPMGPAPAFAGGTGVSSVMSVLAFVIWAEIAACNQRVMPCPRG